MNLASGLDNPLQKRILNLSQRFKVLAQFEHKELDLSKNDQHDANTNQTETNLRGSRCMIRGEGDKNLSR